MTPILNVCFKNSGKLMCPLRAKWSSKRLFVEMDECDEQVSACDR
jgi:hypothetical protein